MVVPAVSGWTLAPVRGYQLGSDEERLEPSGSVTDARLARIQAALRVYGFIRLFNESDALNSLSPDQILASGLDTGGSSGGDSGVYRMLCGMVTATKSTVSPDLIVQVQTPIDAANADGLVPLPNVTLSHLEGGRSHPRLIRG